MNAPERQSRSRPVAGMEVCRQCGTCCVAPDISTLQKAAGERCRHLDTDNRCRIYDERPAVCRGYRPDSICREIAAPGLQERVARYLELFGLSPGENTRRESEPSRHSP